MQILEIYNGKKGTDLRLQNCNYVESIENKAVLYIYLFIIKQLWVKRKNQYHGGQISVVLL